MDAHSAKHDLIASEASHWFVQLRSGGATAQQREQFVVWLRQSAEHVEEFLAVAEVWGDSAAAMEGYATTEALLAEARTARDNVLMLAPKQAIPAEPRKRRHIPRYAAAALAVAGLASVFVWQWSQELGNRRYQTGIGEQLALSLSDGSTVHLNTQSEVRIAFSDRERRIHLRDGEARFHVAKELKRPFIVSTGRTSVQAIGTVFNVYRRDAQTKVTVVEGRVKVLTDARNALPVSVGSANPRAPLATHLSAGEEASIAGGRLNKTPVPNIEHVLAWTEQRLVFRSVPLAEVLEEFNRYNDPPMRVSDPALAQLQISGTFSARDPHSLVEYLRRHEAVAAERTENGSVVLHGSGH